MSFVTAITVLVIVIDRSTRSTVHVRILSAGPLPVSQNGDSDPSELENDFLVFFEYDDERFATGSIGYAYGKFGFDRFAANTLDATNLEDLVGVEIDICYRYKSIGWIPAEDWETVLAEQYHNVSVWPTAEERNSPEGILHRQQWKQRVRRTFRLHVSPEIQPSDPASNK